MIITQERLTDLARMEAEKRADRGRLLAAYLVGTVAHGEPLFAGCADIDLVLVHPTTPIRDHEVMALSADVHFDIIHHDQQSFEPPRELRTHPDLGPSLYNAVRLHDPDHFFDWVQAAACAQFDRPDNQLARSQKFLERARQRRAQLKVGRGWVRPFLLAALDGANSVASLSGDPAYGRRLVHQLRAGFLAQDRADLFARLQQLYGAHDFQDWHLNEWIAAWAKAYDHAEQTRAAPNLDPVRRDYFLRSFQYLSERNEPEAVLLPLLLSWSALPAPAEAADRLAEEVESAWSELLAATSLGVAEQDQKQSELEAFFDDIELHLMQWGEAHGA